MQKLLLIFSFLRNPPRPIPSNQDQPRVSGFCCSRPGNFVVLDAPPTDELCVILNSNASGLYSFLRLLATASPFMAR